VFLVLLMLLMKRFYSQQSLPFEHFLENKKSILKNLSLQVKLQNINDHESKLQELYDNELGDRNIVNVNSRMSSFYHQAPAHQSFTVKSMIHAGMHLGHTTSKWNPKMAPFIYGHRSGIYCS